RETCATVKVFAHHNKIKTIVHSATCASVSSAAKSGTRYTSTLCVQVAERCVVVPTTWSISWVNQLEGIRWVQNLLVTWFIRSIEIKIPGKKYMCIRLIKIFQHISYFLHHL